MQTLNLPTNRNNFQILYIHGFMSSEQSAKAQELASYFRLSDKVDFVTITYPQNDVKKSVTFIENWIINAQKKGKVALIGSSLGGFYAQYFGQKYQLPYCMINPALNADLFYEHLGDHTNPHTNEKVCVNQTYIETLIELNPTTLKFNSPVLLLMDQEDGVIDVDYAKKLYRPVENLEKLMVKVFEGGNHDFVHLEESYPLIEKWLTSSFRL